jgi:hypothetical protein
VTLKDDAVARLRHLTDGLCQAVGETRFEEPGHVVFDIRSEHGLDYLATAYAERAPYERELNALVTLSSLVPRLTWYRITDAHPPHVFVQEGAVGESLSLLDPDEWWR